MRISLSLSALALAASALAATNTTSNPNIVSLLEVVGAQPDLKIAAGYFSKVASLLGNFSDVTVFAPTNAAFAVYVNTSTAHEEDTNFLLVKSIYSYHILNGIHQTFSSDSFLPSSLMPGYYANVTGGQMLQTSGSSLYSGLLSQSNLSGQTLNFSGGVIHAIDKVLTLPQNISATAEALNLTAGLGALESANVTSSLETSADVTLFLPNNEAFKRVASSLTKLNITELAGLLSHHAVAGTVCYSTTVPPDGTTVTALDGTKISLSWMDDVLYADGARIVVSDVLTANGVVHVIDEVLNPDESGQSPNPTLTQVAFTSATSGSSVPFTSGVAAPNSTITIPAIDAATASASVSGHLVTSGTASRGTSSMAMILAATISAAILSTV